MSAAGKKRWQRTAPAKRLTRQLTDCGLPRSRPSPNGKSRQRPGDDESLDLAGAFKDGENLGIPMHPLDGVVAGVAVAAEDLDRFIGDVHRGLAGVQLGHRALG